MLKRVIFGSQKNGKSNAYSIVKKAQEPNPQTGQKLAIFMKSSLRTCLRPLNRDIFVEFFHNLRHDERV